MNQLVVLGIDELHIHEEVNDDAVGRIIDSMRETGKFGPPILVDTKTKIILDGHHRYWACKRFGCKRVPAYCVDYGDESVKLRSWRPDEDITKQDVVNMGLSDGIFPHKTTRHIFTMPDFDPVAVAELMDD